MAEVVLFHHAQGRTDGVLAFADELRAGGHDVAVPDLYEGATFESLGEGVAYAEQQGFEDIISAGVAVAERGPTGVVYAGFSLGGLVAHKLAQTRLGARGALLYHHGDVPVTMFGPSWPDEVGLQIHVSERDEWAELDIVQEFIEVAGASADAELFVYPGSGHLFTDSSLEAYERDSTALVVQRTLTFLDRNG